MSALAQAPDQLDAVRSILQPARPAA
jgi:hypothetical protein